MEEAIGLPNRHFLALITIIVLWAAPAVHGGDWHQPSQLTCSDCHTMHYSEGGMMPTGAEAGGPFPRLLMAGTTNALCLACHDGTDTDAPDVVHPVTYTSDPAGGHFANAGGTASGNAHNLGMSSGEMPPGSTDNLVLSCASCHNPHGTSNHRNLRPNPAGSGNSSDVGVDVLQTKSADGPGGNSPAQVYVPSNLLYRSGMSGWCNDCHPDFHGATETGSPEPWFRHPQDLTVSGRSYADYTHWNGSIPNRIEVESPNDTAVPSADDEVFCLSCHKAHGSATQSGLIYANGSRMLSTCQQCHNQAYESTRHGNAATGIWRIADQPRGDCTHCHDEHASRDGVPTSGGPYDYLLFKPNNNNLCYTNDGTGPCHAGQIRSYFGETTFANSTHGATTSTYNGKPVGWCLQCHTPHGESDAGGLFPNLNKLLEDNVCWPCHDSFGPPGAVNIKAQNDKQYAHDVTDFSRKHDDWDEWSETSNTPNPKVSGTNRHVECEDCHNDHYSTSGLHTQGNSEIPEVLLGAWGVRPIYGLTPWVTASSYEKVRFTDTVNYFEYYLCLKCHSDWAWGSTPPTTTDGTTQTNHAIEFNPNNPAYHNVTGQLAANVPTDDVVYGTSDPLGYINGWEPNSEMICTDCHSNDESASLATGPHGSIHNYMLKKRFRAVAGGQDNTGQDGTQDDLCFECHDWNTYSRNATNSNTNFAKGHGFRNLHAKVGHTEKSGCFTCHAAVIHGLNRKHLIVYETDGLPYYKGPPGEGLEAWQHNGERNYQAGDCRASCHTGHENRNPPNPEP